YALLFAVPIALLAAIYTSEFVNPRVRAVVKPTMEMMASLPSVVLGFIAALVLAPWVETSLAAVIASLVFAPLALLLAAHLWQLLPLPVALRHGGLAKLALIFLALLLGLGFGWAVARPFEDAVFAGDVLAWAAGKQGGGAPFLALVLWPITFLLATYGAARWLPASGSAETGLNALGRWLSLSLVSALLALGLALVLEALGGDPRGGLVGPYVQRNVLVVGFAMGFAVIPIVYTIAEDALASVPEHLRAASLACGATQWQTAMRVILPTAMSGIFAAVMIGMGRAVGETMIVVMAAGNTPILDWNAFSGLRALSANIAVELPEAVKESTLYRMLFLAALALFAMTFVVNTLAELVRLRFRKRAAQL
ncbi:MAG: ABC transporter permease subunit, partial [Alphaproteobacteria bacterium]|nr:ABC transporter permease subunit [Alphaproteobacteria bacterium]